MTAANGPTLYEPPPKCFPLFHRFSRSAWMPNLKHCARCGWYRQVTDVFGSGTYVAWFRPGSFLKGGPLLTTPAPHLDPHPYLIIDYDYSESRVATPEYGFHFEPRAGYSQNREDYRA